MLPGTVGIAGSGTVLSIFTDATDTDIWPDISAFII
jgi:hypothetical protein